MKKSFLVLLAVFAAIGCARVQVEAPKEPIKLDIAMRLDVYQHVVKDIDEIENIVAGKGKKELSGFFITNAYADSLDPQVEAAAIRRRDRKGSVASLLSQGSAGEGRNGLLVQRSGGGESVIQEENADRMVIYQALAQKNGTSVSDVQKLYAERLQKDAPSGAPVEQASGEWTTK